MLKLKSLNHESFNLTLEFRNHRVLMQYQEVCTISLSGYSVDNKESLYWPWSWEEAQNENFKHNTTTTIILCLEFGKVEKLIQDRITTKGNMMIKPSTDTPSWMLHVVLEVLGILSPQKYYFSSEGSSVQR